MQQSPRRNAGGFAVHTLYCIAMHTCSRCKQTKEHSAFAPAPRYRSGLQSYCKDCHRVYARARLYKITPEELEYLFQQQDHKCATCNESLDKQGSGTHVDHCHTTGRIRGLLCRGCNLALGCVKDDPAVLQRMIEYVKEPVL